MRAHSPFRPVTKKCPHAADTNWPLARAIVDRSNVYKFSVLGCAGSDGGCLHGGKKMSLSLPEAQSFGDDGESTGEDAYICKASENLIAVIEKCLDNGLGACLVVADDNHLVGRVALDDIGKAVLEGALLNPTIGQHLEALGHRLHNNASANANVLRPLLDGTGGLIGV